MRGGAGFLDTDVLVYAFSRDGRAAAARSLLGAGCVVGVQCLNEFANVARRKLGFSWIETREALGAICALCRVVVPVDVGVHEVGLDIAERYGSALSDGMILAAALRGGCTTLWSEDCRTGCWWRGGSGSPTRSRPGPDPSPPRNNPSILPAIVARVEAQGGPS